MSITSPEAIPWVGDDWFIAEWPDGSWCDWNERHLMSYKSDDYEKRRVLTFDPNGYFPEATERVTP